MKIETGIKNYLTDLEERGKKSTTINAADRVLSHFQMALATEEERECGSVMPDEVFSFIDSDYVQNKQNGKPRALPSLNQIKSIVRQNMIFWTKAEYTDIDWSDVFKQQKLKAKALQAVKDDDKGGDGGSGEDKPFITEDTEEEDVEEEDVEEEDAEEEDAEEEDTEEEDTEEEEPQPLEGIGVKGADWFGPEWKAEQEAEAEARMNAEEIVGEFNWRW